MVKRCILFVDYYNTWQCTALCVGLCCVIYLEWPLLMHSTLDVKGSTLQQTTMNIVCNVVLRFNRKIAALIFSSVDLCWQPMQNISSVSCMQPLALNKATFMEKLEIPCVCVFEFMTESILCSLHFLMNKAIC